MLSGLVSWYMLLLYGSIGGGGIGCDDGLCKALDRSDGELDGSIDGDVLVSTGAIPVAGMDMRLEPGFPSL